MSDLSERVDKGIIMERNMVILEDENDMNVSFSYILMFDAKVDKALQSYIQQVVDRVKSTQASYEIDDIIAALRIHLKFVLIPCNEVTKIMY